MQNNDDATLLLVEIPRTNDKKELSAEQMFASLHGILKPRKSIFTDSRHLQDRISLEMAAIGQRIRFYIWVPTHLQSFVEGQVYAQYPTAQISVSEDDYSMRAITQKIVYSTELVLTDNETLPIKSFPSFEVDPLAAITATLAKLDQPNEEMWVQIIIRPISDDWHRKSVRMASRIKTGGGTSWSGGLSYFGQALGAMIKPPEATEKTTYEPSERDKTRITAIEEKSRKLGYQIKMRILYAGNEPILAKQRMQAMVGTFKQFNTTNLNGFQSKYPSFDRAKLINFRERVFADKGYILNIEELASIYHLPHTTVETPNIVWATTKTAEPPATLPLMGTANEKDISLFGVTNFRGTHNMFGILRADRGRHMYILGQTGTGKSGLLELLTLSDIYYNQGFAIIDPHGDYATSVIKHIPKHRIKDVIYFNPSDEKFPIGFNPLEVVDSTSKGQVSSELVGVLKRMFESWGPRLEYILRYTILALLDYPGATLLDITRMLTEKEFRNDVISHIDDIVVKNFWTKEFASWNDKFANEAVAPVLNKVGAFTANPLVRNIIGQQKSTFNIRKAMDDGKIFIVNLSKGLVGEDNAAILGSLLVTKIQLAAMSRSDIANVEDRRPFYLYVDEFQNFATDSFAVILSEARKYGLNLTVANQYISQMEEEVRNAVFGNVGSMITFRVSPDDSPFLIKYYEPQFEDGDLSNFHNRNFVASMSVNGEKTVAFSATTLNIPEVAEDNSNDIIEFSRQRYSSPVELVEKHISEISLTRISDIQQQPKPGAPASTNNTANNNEPKLSASQKRRLRRKRATETAGEAEQPQQHAASETPAANINDANKPPQPPQNKPKQQHQATNETQKHTKPQHQGQAQAQQKKHNDNKPSQKSHIKETAAAKHHPNKTKDNAHPNTANTAKHSDKPKATKTAQQPAKPSRSKPSKPYKSRETISDPHSVRIDHHAIPKKSQSKQHNKKSDQENDPTVLHLR